MRIFLAQKDLTKGKKFFPFDSILFLLENLVYCSSASIRLIFDRHLIWKLSSFWDYSDVHFHVCLSANSIQKGQWLDQLCDFMVYGFPRLFFDIVEEYFLRGLIFYSLLMKVVFFLYCFASWYTYCKAFGSHVKENN